MMVWRRERSGTDTVEESLEVIKNLFYTQNNGCGIIVKKLYSRSISIGFL